MDICYLIAIAIVIANATGIRDDPLYRVLHIFIFPYLTLWLHDWWQPAIWLGIGENINYLWNGWTYAGSASWIIKDGWLFLFFWIRLIVEKYLQLGGEKLWTLEVTR